jgi:hypothetical protein
MRFLERARRARPSNVKLHDDKTNVKNRKNQFQKTSFISPLKKIA